jgi:hypothetical protein
MTPDEWHDLETLCRKALDELDDMDPSLRDHPIAQALATTGAFAAAVQHHTEPADA